MPARVIWRERLQVPCAPEHFEHFVSAEQGRTQEGKATRCTKWVVLTHADWLVPQLWQAPDLNLQDTQVV